MVASLKNLSETIDKATTDRKVADEIQARLPQIREEIQRNGYSVVELQGKKYKVTGSSK